MPPPQPAVAHLALSLRPDELVAAWRPDVRRLSLPARVPLRPQQRVVATIALAGAGAGATIAGRVVSASRAAGGDRFELAPDDLRVKAVERLVALARGEVVDWAPRIPRYLATVPAVVQGPIAPTYMTTFSVSAKGCGLAWTGPLPAVGAPVDVRLGAGSGAARLRSVVCWTAQSGRAAMVGVRFVAGAQGAWETMVAELARSGAPAA
jgi:hypothetical protein